MPAPFAWRNSRLRDWRHSSINAAFHSIINAAPCAGCIIRRIRPPRPSWFAAQPGAILDVIVDLRPDSPTYRQHFGIELTSSNRLSLYVPEMFAHGFQTLADETEVAYQIRGMYAPEKARGLRFDDPALGIAWPLTVTSISEKDRQWPWLT